MKTFDFEASLPERDPPIRIGSADSRRYLMSVLDHGIAALGWTRLSNGTHLDLRTADDPDAVQIVMGIALWSPRDLEDLEFLASTSRSIPFRASIFEFADCLTAEDVEAFVPGAGSTIYKTPVLAVYRRGHLLDVTQASDVRARIAALGDDLEGMRRQECESSADIEPIRLMEFH